MNEGMNEWRITRSPLVGLKEKGDVFAGRALVFSVTST